MILGDFLNLHATRGASHENYAARPAIHQQA
jgi:hypothetical protein